MKRITLALFGVLAVFSIINAPAFAQTNVTCDQDYTIVAGDWLSKLAEKYFGSPSAYPAIVTQTNLKSETDFTYATIVNPDSVEVGWKLCIPSADTAKQLNGDNAPPGLDKTALGNATYSSELVPDGHVTVTNGKWSMPVGGGSPAQEALELTGQYAWGDLNGVPSAVVVTGSTGGGTGFFYILSVMQARDGKPVEVSTTGTGDRSPVLAVVIENNQVKVDYLTQGPDQPMCCGNLRVIDTYKLDGDKMTQTDHKELGNLGPNGETPGAPVLENIVWKWQGSTKQDGTKVTPDDPSKYTVEFVEDGYKVNLKADCNSGGGTYTATANTIKMSPLITTLVGCPEGSLGSEFTQELQAASGYHFDNGNLVLTLTDGTTMNFVK
ncbi:MAG TPA: META domain-containing protein [Anaerolineae bacterium]|nr:META domain-containing protein [Anaerolineae bacterium]